MSYNYLYCYWVRVRSQQNCLTGLVAYLGEKPLVAQFIDMKIVRNISANLKAFIGEMANREVPRDS